METKTRTICKSLTWRVTALIITTSVVWVATGKLHLAAEIGLADTAIKLFVYYAHERCWLKAKFGRLRQPDYQI